MLDVALYLGRARRRRCAGAVLLSSGPEFRGGPRHRLRAEPKIEVGGDVIEIGRGSIQMG